MAIIDSSSGKVVVRIVYAGSPMSGKTESVRQLATILLGSRADSAVISPGEAEGRTLYFDWLDYEGGLYKGKKVRCQIVTVPGQPAFRERRQSIMKTADAVIFVTGSSAGDVKESCQYYQEMQPWLEQPDDHPDVGRLVQANKRDLDACVTTDSIRQQFGDSKNLMVTQSVATTGIGIRETFVMSVGLALERVHALAEFQLLQTGSSEIDCAESLLEQLRVTAQQEDSSNDSKNRKKVARSAADFLHADDEQNDAQRLVEIFRENKLSGNNKNYQPCLPNYKLAAGSVWPAVSGRIMLHEMAGYEMFPEKNDKGDWYALINKKWRLFSYRCDAYSDENLARKQLLSYARWNMKHDTVIFPHRCFALVKQEDQQTRIWQIVRADNSLLDTLNTLFKDELSSHDMAGYLVEITHQLVVAHENIIGSGISIDANLRAIGMHQQRPLYLGMIPKDVADIDLPSIGKTAAVCLIRKHVAKHIKRGLQLAQVDIPAVVRVLEDDLQDSRYRPYLIETLIAILIGH